MWRNKFFLISLLGISLFVCIGATADTQEVSQSFGGETVSLKIPSDWKLDYHDESKVGQIYEYVPNNQTVQKWDEMVTVQIFPGISQRATPGTFLGLIIQRVKDTCKGAKTELLMPEKGRTDLNNRAMAITACPNYSATGLGEITSYQAIAGVNAMFLVMVAWRSKPFATDSIPYTQAMHEFSEKVFSTIKFE